MPALNRALNYLVLAVVALGAWSCTTSSEPIFVNGPQPAGAVDAVLDEFVVDISDSSIPAGDVTFVINNDGLDTHEFVVIATDLDADLLPINPDGSVDESDPDVDVVDAAENIPPGASVALSMSLAPGHYVAISNIADDYSQGMFVEFIVD